MNKKTKKLILQYGELLLGSFLFALAVNVFVQPSNLNNGGFVGLAQIFSYLILGNGRLTGALNFAINIPLMILSYKGISKGFFFKTIISLFVQSMFMTVLPVPSQMVMPDVLSNCILGGVVAGIGIGLQLLAAGSGGGLDSLGVYLSKKAPDFSVAKLSYIINIFVLGWSAFLFDMTTALYSFIYIVIAYFVSDHIHYQNINVYAIIITQHPELKQIIMDTMRRGVTYWKGKGAYTDQPNEILLCIMSRYEVRTVKKLVHQTDPKAFFLLSKGNPLLGNFEKRLTD